MTSAISLLIVLAVACSYIAYEFARMNSLILTGRSLAHSAEAFQRAEGARNMLVLGDSTAVGVGSDPEYSVPGRLSTYLDSSVENVAVSGATTDDVLGQFKQVPHKEYDLVLIQVGANDVLYFKSLFKAEESLRVVLEEAQKRSDRVVLLTAGRIGDAPLLPWFLRPVFNVRAALLRERFIRIAREFGVVYVDLFARLDPFRENVQRYYADDQLHLSADGYGYWFGIVREYVEKQWPEFERQ